MEIKDLIGRIEKLIEDYNLTIAEFAERIGTSRSAISHILSGRNKPSLSLVVSIVEEFPALTLDSLVLGTEPDIKPKNSVAQRVLPGLSADVDDKAAHDLPNMSKDQILENGKSLQKVILCYDDGTFENFIL
ncbi:MAG: helix-turn-helix transcriptional regulator [Nonlabens sp.]